MMIKHLEIRLTSLTLIVENVLVVTDPGSAVFVMDHLWIPSIKMVIVQYANPE
jgi:hypothetical protein